MRKRFYWIMVVAVVLTSIPLGCFVWAATFCPTLTFSEAIESFRVAVDPAYAPDVVKKMDQERRRRTGN